MNFENKNDKLKFVMIVIITAMITFLVTAFFYSNFYTNTKVGIRKVINNQTKKTSITKIEEKLSLMKYTLNKYFLGDLDEDDMIEGAIKGYVEGIGDPYTEYLTKDKYESLLSVVEGNYVGIGVYISKTKNDQIIILAPIEGSPAEEVGLKAGDIVLTANGEDLTGLDTDFAVTKIKGEEGTFVELEVLRDNETLKFTVERKKIELKDMESKMLDNNIGYIQLVSFDESCASEFLEHYNKLKSEGATSLIVDIRDNGGGLVTEVLELADSFIPKDKNIMVTLDKDENKKISISEKDPQIKDIKIVVLINQNSASASEILAGALQDNEIATIVGKTTYGKGVMQDVIPFGSGALKVTIEEFRTPNGNIINEKGIVPDVEIEDNKETKEDEQLEKAIEILKNS